MADGQFGDISGDQFREIRDQASEAIANIKAYRQELNSFGDDAFKGLASTLQDQVNLAKSLSSINKDNIADEVKKKSFQDNLSKAKAKEADLAKQIAKVDSERKQLSGDIAKKVEEGYSLNSKVVRKLREQLRSRQSEQEVLLYTKETTGDLVKNAEALAKAVAEAGSKTKLFDNMLSAVRELPVLGRFLEGPFRKAAEAAGEAAKEGKGRLNTFLQGSLGLAKGLLAQLGPAAILGAILKVSEQAGNLNKQLGLGMEASRRMRDRFAEVGQNSGSARFNTEKLVKANVELNAQLGTSIEFSGQMLQDFVQMTEYMGLSAGAAGKLATLGKITGQESSEFAGNIAESVVSANKANGVFISTSKALEKVKDLSGTTLLNLRRNPEAIAEAIVATEKLGMSFQQLRNTANSLLDFESSISNELEAELLTGRELNLERARAAALRGNDLELAKELANQVGTLADYESMNVIQRESLAKAFGMNSDAMADMLIKQELMNKLGKEAKDLSSEQAREINQLVKDNPGMTPQQALLELQSQETATKKFQDAVAKLKNVFTDIVSFLEPYIQKFGNFIETISSSGIAKTLMGGGMMVAAGLALKNLAFPRGTMLNPMVTRPVGVGSAGGGMMSTLPGGSRYAAAMRANSMGRFGMSRAMGAGAGLGFGMGGALVQMGGNALASKFEESGNMAAAQTTDIVSGAGQGALYGAALGSVVPVIGTAAGAVIGGAIGLISGGIEASNRRAEEQAKKDEENKKLEKNHYAQMVDQLRVIAKKESEIYMDGNKVGLGLVQSNPQLGD